MFDRIGTVEIIVIAAIILLFVGGRKLPELAKGIRDAIAQLKGSVKEDKPIELKEIKD
jgi:Sec-independent protein translocase protein TatA